MRTVALPSLPIHFPKLPFRVILSRTVTVWNAVEVAVAGMVIALGITGTVHAQTTQYPQLFGPDYEVSFGLLRDTIYVLDSTYLEVRLDQQMIYHRFRSGRVDRYPCSTGDPRIVDGIATREGIFTVQWKARKHLSQQFNVYLNYWMPFDGGIGFHGLEGRSYYRHLGKRRSSHGCVRISNETGSSLFPRTPRGTLVYVHSGSPARVLAFADSTMDSLMVMDQPDHEILAQRLDDVVANHWTSPSLTPRLALSARTRLSKGIAVGRVDARRITQRPITPVKRTLHTSSLDETPRLQPLPQPAMNHEPASDESL